MSDEEFLLTATVLAEEHLDDELAIQFLEACDSPNSNHMECINLAGRLVVKLAA